MLSDQDYVQALPVGVRHVGGGLAVPSPSAEALRTRRHILLAGCQRLAYPFWVEKIDGETGEIKKKTEFRVSICGRQSVDDSVSVYRNGQTVGTSGVYRCGNVWSCPICAAKVGRIRGEQLGKLFSAVHSAGGAAVMATFTAAHKLDDPLQETLERFKNAKRRMQQGRKWVSLLSALPSMQGSVSSTEITYSPSAGWHPHQHDAWFFTSKTVDADSLAQLIFPHWESACNQFGLKTQFEFRGRRIGLDVRPAWDASEYMAKFERERSWSLDREVTGGRLKMARGASLTSWAVLEEAVIHGPDSEAARLWIEYMRSTKGKSWISFIGARKLCQKLGLPTRFDDYRDANQIGEGEVITKVSAADYDRVIRAGALGGLLEAARSNGAEGVINFLNEKGVSK